MMDLINDLKLSALAFRQMKAGSGEMMACVVVRGTFHIIPGQTLVWAEQQEPIQFEDVYQGDPLTTPLIRCSDIVPFKPKADLTLLAWASRPASQSDATWLSGLIFNGKPHAFRVCGRRYWDFRPAIHENQSGHWQLSDVESIPNVMLSWTLAYGGSKPLKAGQSTADVVPANPIGCGYVDWDASPKDQRILAPSILRDEESHLEACHNLVPYGCAPVSPWWLWRQKYAGTYDKAWLDEVHPRLPLDFDYHFYQCAAPEMVYDSYFRGGETVRLINVHSQHHQIDFLLPQYRPIAQIKRKTSEVFTVSLNMDGCHINLLTENQAAKVILTWRAWVPFQPEVSSIRLGMQGLDTMIREGVAARSAIPLHGMPKWPS